MSIKKGTIFILVFALLICCGCNSFLEQRKQHYYKKGQKLYEEGEYIEAVDEFNKALAFDQGFAEAIFMIGMCRFNQEEYDKAIDLFAKAYGWVSSVTDLFKVFFDGKRNIAKRYSIIYYLIYYNE